MKIKNFTFFLLPIAVFVVLSSSKIDPNNPPTGRTGAPGETTCQAAGCHSGGTYEGSVEITGLPDTVVANQSYPITLTNTSDAIKSGFQLTVLSEANTKVGTLTAGTGCSLGNAGGRQYVRQSSPHTLMNGATSWTFTWKAPASVVDDSIHFYFATLCANGNGQKTGDNALNSLKSVVLPTFVSATEHAADSPKIKLFPNPSSDFLSVQVPGKSNLKVLDANGKTILNAVVTDRKNLDISSLQNGLYIVQIECQGKVENFNFVKQ